MTFAASFSRFAGRAGLWCARHGEGARPAARVGDWPGPCTAAARRGFSALALAALGGCAGFGAGPGKPAVTSDIAAVVAADRWQAALPHQGQATDLARWWQQFDDPLLPALIDAAQAASPSISSAQARIADARASRIAAGAGLLPSVGANLSAQRSSADASLGAPSASTRLSAGASVAWEADLFGGQAAARDAAQARLEGAQAGWHGARVAVAAEVASQYTSLRACEAQTVQARADADSRSETARLTGLTAKAGFEAPATAALARASAAQARAQLAQQEQQCDTLLKGLVALTGRDEPGLRAALAPQRARLAQPAGFALPELPAALLRQRPDLASAERTLQAARADIAQAQAARLPALSLSGNLGRARVSAGGFTANDSTWAVGPVTLSVPLFDGGTRRANVDASRARFDDAALQYAAVLRGAVREVESALLTLDATERRRADLATAADGYATALQATEARQRGGLASLFELEDARRSAVNAQVALIELQRERITAWIELYRALGGGWAEADLKTVAAR